jgi:hypothetical protein
MNGGMNLTGRSRTGLALVTAALSLGGCGSSSHSLTRAQLIAKGDAICSRVDAESGSFTIRTDHDHALYLPALAAYEQAASSEMRALVPPDSMANDWRQIVADAQAVADSMTRVGEYAQSHKPSAAPKALYAPAATAVQDMLTVAQRDGFKACAQRY